jgi:small subunit ribosomal protein S4
VRHGHIILNGRKTNVPSYLVKEGDTIGWREGSRKNEYYKTLAENIEGKTVLSWLSLDRQNLVGQVLTMPTPEQIGATFDAKAVTEYYSR